MSSQDEQIEQRRANLAELGKLGVSTSEVAYTLTHQGLNAALQEIPDAIAKKFPAGSAEYNAALRAAVGGTRGFTAALEGKTLPSTTYRFSNADAPPMDGLELPGPAWFAVPAT